MKKTILCLFIFSILTIFPTYANLIIPENILAGKSTEVIMIQLYKTRDIEKTSLSRTQKRQLQKEIKFTDEDTPSRSRVGMKVYISAAVFLAAVIVLIVLL